MTREAREAAGTLLSEHGLRVPPQRYAIWAAYENGAAGHLSPDTLLRRARPGTCAVFRISAKTVGHHVEHVWQKAGVRGQTAATPRAFEPDLVPTR